MLGMLPTSLFTFQFDLAEEVVVMALGGIRQVDTEKEVQVINLNVNERSERNLPGLSLINHKVTTEISSADHRVIFQHLAFFCTSCPRERWKTWLLELCGCMPPVSFARKVYTTRRLIEVINLVF